MIRTSAALGVSAIFGLSLHAELNFTGLVPVVIDFDTTVAGVNDGAYAGTGLQPVPATGQLDSDAWKLTGIGMAAAEVFGADLTSGSAALGVSAGGETGGGLHAFDDGDGGAIQGRAFGFQPTSSIWTPGTVTLKLRNSTGGVLDRIAVSYTALVFNDQNRANSFGFGHAPDPDGPFSEAVPAIVSTEAEDLSPVWVAQEVSVTLDGLNLADGDNYYLQWFSDDVSGSGSRDEFALDNIRLSLVPEPGAYGAVAAVGLLGFAAWRRRCGRKR